MPIYYLDKRSATYRQFSGQIDSLGRQAQLLANGNGNLAGRIGDFLDGTQLQCTELQEIIEGIRAKGLNNIAGEAEKLRRRVAESAIAEFMEYKNRTRQQQQGSQAAARPGAPQTPDRGISNELSEMKRTGNPSPERIGEILETEIGVIALTQCFNILGTLGARRVGAVLVKKAITRAVGMAQRLDSQAIANVLNALPKLGERVCPAELKARAIAVSGSMNSQEIANVLNALPKLGERVCPAELIKRLLDEEIIRELQFGAEYYEQLVIDLQKFKNLDEIKSALVASKDQTIQLLYQKICEPTSAGPEPAPELEPELAPEPAPEAEFTPAQIVRLPSPQNAAPPEPLEQKSLDLAQIAWMRKQQLVNLLERCKQNGITHAGDLSRAIEAAKLKVPAGLSKLARILAAENGDLFSSHKLYQYLAEQQQ